MAPDVIELVGRSEAHHTLARQVHGDHLDGEPPLHVLRGQALALLPPGQAPGGETPSFVPRTVWLGRGGGVAPGPGPRPPDHGDRSETKVSELSQFFSVLDF